MGRFATAAPEATPAAAPAAPAAEAPKSEEKAAARAAMEKIAVTPEDRKVRGQVRMHAIIAGYHVAGTLAPTLANTAANIKDELHKLAEEVAQKVEAYSFKED